MTDDSAPILRFVRVLAAQENLEATDGDLLARFTTAADEAAFTVLVDRHAGMVLQVCRSLLPEEAEDAFQATFLVLARQARSLRKSGSLGSWLYGIAYRTCLKARASRAARRLREGQNLPRHQPGPLDELTSRETQAILHEELAQLPTRYRAPLVLCYLEGKCQDEAGTLLGWPPGKLRGMLERARQLIRKRLRRRGFGPAAALFTAGGFSAAAQAIPPRELLVNTVHAALSPVSGPAAVSAVVSARVMALCEGVIRTMIVSKILKISTFVLLAGVVVAGVAGLTYQALASGQRPPQLQREASIGTSKAVLQGARTQADQKKEKKEKDKQKVVKLTAAEVKAVRQGDKEAIDQAKKKLAGKVGELTALGWASYQDQKMGDQAGETLFSFDMGEAETGEWTGNTIPVYFKDKKDIAVLKNRKLGDKTLFKVRGELVMGQDGWRLSMVDARLVKEEKEE
jgi:RNA polymerase sigma factor (sigma-70 family)